MRAIDGKLLKFYQEAALLARETYNLDFFDIEFYVLTSDYLNSIAGHGGFPRTIEHWRNGLEQKSLKERYNWGHGKIYELVINTDPSYAYLMDNNSELQQEFVICHVIGHVDFFKNNIYFSKTNRNMLNQIANHATRVERYAKRFGQVAVEEFIDSCRSIEENIDSFAPFCRRSVADPVIGDTRPDLTPDLYPCDPQMDLFYNSPEYIIAKKKELEKKIKRERMFPERPEKDVLGFLAQNAPLTMWQRDILGMIRAESIYFNPQRQTKILNEGWASYWHHKMMTGHFIHGEGAVNFALTHSGVLSWNPWRMNPYYLGFALLHDIERRWNKGQFGEEWDNCKDARKRAEWDTGINLGAQKILQVRQEENDYSFIDKYLTPEFCEEHKFYLYEFDPNVQKYVIKSRDFGEIKNHLLSQYANWGIPYIVVYDANYKNRGELLLFHRHETDLRQDWAKDTLKHISNIWQRPVHLLTKLDGKHVLLSHGGEDPQSTPSDDLVGRVAKSC